MVHVTNKGQMISQIFIFLLAGLVFVLIISYGYKAVQHFVERQEQILLVDYRADLELSVDAVRRDYGSVRKLELRLPSDYLGICILDYDACAQPTLEHPTTTITAPWATEACNIKSANVVTIPRSVDIDLPDVDVDGYVCAPALDGKVTLRLEGTGRKTKITIWE